MQYKPKGLQHYANVYILRERGILQGVLTGVFDNQSLLAFGAQPAPDTISWATDQEQTQLTGGEFIIAELEVMGCRFNDWFHRVSNDLETAQADRSRLVAIGIYKAASVFFIGEGLSEPVSYTHLTLPTTPYV